MTLAHPRSSSSPADTLIPPEVVRIDLPQATIDALRLLSPETLTKVAKALRDSVAKEIERSQIWTYYPDEGPLRRDLYVKHMEFFSAGLFHQERAFIAANRCVAPWTVVETDQGPRRIDSMTEGSFNVVAWTLEGPKTFATDGPAFHKGFEQGFHLTLSNGESFDCSWRHRFLTDLGYMSLGGMLTDCGLNGGGWALAGGISIKSIEPRGCIPIWDLTVPGPANYLAHGVYHHNSGKTHAVCYETALHMLGEYPSWWVGRRFSRPVTCWLSGEDGKAVRESLQEKMLGRYGNFGTGFIPGKALLETRPRLGVPEAIDIFSVRHKPTGGTSRAVFKAYEQGRESFQSAAVDVVVFDEEPPMPIYTEGLTRTLSTKPHEASGMVMCSFTPLRGISETVLQFLPGGHLPETLDSRKAAWGW